MAKRHVVSYYLQLENEYIGMQETLKELQELAKDGKVEESMVQNVMKEVDIIKTNYDRLSYVMFLLNKPNRAKKDDYDEKVNRAWYDYLKTSSKEAIVDETRDALAEFKKMVRNLKESEDE